MTIHKEGYVSVLASFFVFLILGLVFYLLFPIFKSWHVLFYAILLLGFLGIVSFFRSPNRAIKQFPGQVLSPADGTVVVIEEVHESEYFNQSMLQVSIFMSPLNVHINRYPISGELKYYKYHPGKYLVAWHPKSSTLNERTSIVIRDKKGREMLIRQIAGALARRIVCYAKKGFHVEQGSELGFIKFGSRADLFLPLNTHIRVKKGDRVKAGINIIAELPN
jgi:phosphatidylserine decarboxylase